VIRPDLVVVLCTYNGAGYVREQVRSILGQTVLPAQLLVFDDGSTDDTLEMISEEFSARPSEAAGVELVTTESEGVKYGAVGNFERGLRTATSAIVALADQDDVWRPTRIARGLAVLDTTPEIDLVASNASFIDGDGTFTGVTVFEAQHVATWELDAMAERETLPVLARRNVLPGMTFTLRRDLFVRAGAVPPGAMHDYWLALSAAATNSLAIIADPLVDYRIHGGNAVGLDAGNRSLTERVHARLQLIRSPLADIAQWRSLAERLRQDDPYGYRRLVLAKLRFERRRRFPGQHGLRRLVNLVRLLRSGDYDRFDVGGWRGAVKDYLRPAADDLETIVATS
jgi:glycosyltransferase involved in cell wall biosynthesis